MAFRQIIPGIQLQSAPLQLFSNAVLLVAVIAIGALLVDYGRMLWMRRRLPPGPFPLPIVGNHFQTPSVKPWIEWERWAKYYNSPMVTLWIGREPRIILSDAWVAHDLLEKKSEIFSSRPRLIAMGDAINTTHTNQTTLVYGDRWRLHRKLMHMAVGSQSIRNYRIFQGDEAIVLMKDLLEDPEDFVMNIERYTISVTSIIGWGRRVDRKNDYVAQQALKFMEAVNLVIPGLYLMEAVPALLYAPAWLYKFPSLLRSGSAVLARYFYLLTEEGAEAGAKDQKRENFGKYMLNSQKKHGLTDLEVAGLMTNLIGGGVDTTSSTMISTILALAAFPEAQAKAHAEVDAFVGHDRSPTFADIDANRLPYCTAVVKEVLRWRSVAVLAGIPHANTIPVDYECEGKKYHFPAGTNFTGNLWAIHRHPRDFPDPDVFRPERFLENDPASRPYPNARGSNPFGWGRRICSGLPMAEQGLLFSLTRLIWCFDILPALDPSTGQPIPLDIFAYTESENMRPEAFKAQFIPRSEKIRRLIVEEAREARERLSVFDGETRVRMEDAVRDPIKL